MKLCGGFDSQSDRAALVDEVAALRHECAQHTMTGATLED